jgi:hypothetical protein
LDRLLITNQGFIDCSRRVMWTKLQSRINCSIPGLEFFERNGSTLNRCKTQQEGDATRQELYNLAYDFQGDTVKYGCPLPCRRRRHSVSLLYYHNTSWIEVEPETMLNFGFQVSISPIPYKQILCIKSYENRF